MTLDHQFTWATIDGVAVVRPPSEVDMSNADSLRSCCQEAIDVSGAPRIVVDLADTTFIDSTALGVFVGLAKRAKADGGWLRLVTGESSGVQKILRLTALERTLGNYPTVDAAISA